MPTHVKFTLLVTSLLATSAACSLDQLDKNFFEEANARAAAPSERPDKPPPVRPPLDSGVPNDAAPPFEKDASEDAGWCGKPKHWPPPQGCERLTIESNRCIDWQEAKARVVDGCEAQGLILTELQREPDESCPRDTARETSALCCPPESYSGCETRFGGDGQTCVDPQALMELADADCVASDRWMPTLTSPADPHCGARLHSRSVYVCCPEGVSPALWQ